MPARILPFTCHTSTATSLINSAKNPELLDDVLLRCVEENGCLIWSGSKSTAGLYGTKWIDGGIDYVHRIAYRAFHGEIPAGSLKHETDSIEVDHLCGHRLCANPNHLSLKTRNRHNLSHAAMRMAA